MMLRGAFECFKDDKRCHRLLVGSTILLSVGGVGVSREEMNLQGRPSDQDVAAGAPPSANLIELDWN